MTTSTLFGTLCIRADACPHMGIGHVMRCIALAQAWQDRGGNVILISSNLPEALSRRCLDENIQLHKLIPLNDEEETVHVYKNVGAIFLVLDGYHFTNEYRSYLKKSGLRLLVIDDLAEAAFKQVDIVLNHNGYASEAMYLGRVALTGSRFTLLRREFLVQRACSPFSNTPNTVLVTMGGGDPRNETLHVLEHLASYKERRLQVKIIVGVGNPHLSTLQNKLPIVHDCEIIVNPPNLPKLMNQADIAITGAGSTCWELANLGVPMLLRVIADNQQGIADYLLSHAAGRLFDPAALRELLADAGARQTLAQNARSLVDGRGAGRVAENLACHPISLRRATLEDALMLLAWANDPVTRQGSFNSEPIPWETHVAWMQRRLNDEQCTFSIAEDGDQAIGTVRFDHREAGVAEISLSLAPAARGRGLGPKLIRLGTFSVLDEGFCTEVRGRVKHSNTSSLRVFERAGFRKLSQDTESVEFTATAASLAAPNE